MSPVLETFANASARGFRPGALVTGAYEWIATATGTGSSGVITFNSGGVWANYENLQIRFSAKNTSTTTGINLTFNSSTTGYARHQMEGAGGTGATNGVSAQAAILLSNSQSNSTTAFATSGGVLDITNVNSTTTNKVVRGLYGQADSTNFVEFVGGLWVSTAALTSITFTSVANNFATTTRFSLYGIKG